MKMADAVAALTSSLTDLDVEMTFKLLGTFLRPLMCLHHSALSRINCRCEPLTFTNYLTTSTRRSSPHRPNPCSLTPHQEYIGPNSSS